MTSVPFTRPRRQLVFGSIAAVITAAVTYGVLWKQSDPRYATFLSGWPVMSEGEKSYVAYGATEWLIVHRNQWRGNDGRLRTERRYHVNPQGLMPTLVILAGGICVCVWTHRRLVHRLTLSGYCDWCGYDLRALESARCPECGTSIGATNT
ncbi:MAG: hypothetical protein ACYTGC_15990 [Planctomycetota bacterium]|jgi:hypothetical protein